MNKKSLTIILTAVFVIFVVSYAFTNSYTELENSIDDERVQYIGEIEKQLASRSKEIRDDISSNLNFLVYLIKSNKPKSFIDADKDYSKISSDNDSQLVLVSESGICYNIDNTIFELQDKELLKELIIDKKPISRFERLSNGQNFLITAQPIEPFEIENQKIVAIMFATSEILYRSRMTLPLFGSSGISFVCDNLGRLVISPKKDSFNIIGYNLFSSLEELEVNQNIINNIKNDFLNGQSNYYYFKLTERWLIQYESFNNGEEFIISLIPVSIVSNRLITDVSKTLQMAYLTLFFILVLILILVIVIFDIISQKNRTKFESNVREQAALSRSEFLSQMSHDMRTPLSAIVGMAELAKENLYNEEIIDDSLDKVKSSANYILEIINDILDLSKIESGNFSLINEPFSLNELVRNIEIINQSKAFEKDLYYSFNYNINEDIWYVGDKLRISQILMNLISNAIKFTPEKGSVNIKIQTEEYDTKSDTITFIVKDTGIGMSKDYIKDLFIPYIQENDSISSVYGGTGLGLAIVDNLIKLMNGRIKVISEKGLGSEFIVKITLEKVTNPFLKNNKESFNINLSGQKVLFIEDHPINRLIGEKQLQSIGFSVDSAENGKTGLDLFFKHKTNYYSLILTDIRMPVVDGYQVIKQIRESQRLDKDLPIIIMSANAKDENIHQELKVNAILCKPVNINELKDAICLIFKK